MIVILKVLKKSFLNIINGDLVQNFWDRKEINTAKTIGKIIVSDKF